MCLRNLDVMLWGEEPKYGYETCFNDEEVLHLALHGARGRLRHLVLFHSLREVLLRRPPSWRELASANALSDWRLLGFAAIEKREKRPARQAPILEMEHILRLHEVPQVGTDLVDRLDAGAFLICIYGRARWSEVRHIQKIELERRRNGALTIYITERKTSKVGLRREHSFRGVVSHEWVSAFPEVYAACGLEIKKLPLAGTTLGWRIRRKTFEHWRSVPIAVEAPPQKNNADEYRSPFAFT